MEKEKLAAITQQIRDNELTSLKLSNMAMDPEDAKALAAALKHNTSLTELDLSRNQIGDDGARAIMEALEHNTSLTELDLSYNQIGNAGVQFIMDALAYNGTLAVLKLCLNQIGDGSAEAIATALTKNKALITLDLSHTQIGNAGAIAIAAALETNNTLISLYLNVENIDSDIVKRIRTLLDHNFEIQVQMEELREIYMGEPHIYLDWLHTYPGSAPIPQPALEGTCPFKLSQNKHLFWRIDQYQASLLEWMPLDTMQKLPAFQKALYTSPTKPGK